MGNIPAGATVTIYRAKHEFEYRQGETIGKGQPWQPKGERNDDYIKKHLCYADLVAIEEDDEPAEKKTTVKGSGRKKA